MAINTRPMTIRWPKPDTIDVRWLKPYYDHDIDLLELSFTKDPTPRVEVPLETSAVLTPLASVRLDEHNELTGEVVGVMIQNLSTGFAEHPGWRDLANGEINQATLASLIETFSKLSVEADTD